MSVRLKRGERLWTVYQDRAGDWRWRAVAANYRVIDASEEGFRRRRYAAQQAIRRGAPQTLREPTVYSAVSL